MIAALQRFFSTPRNMIVTLFAGPFLAVVFLLYGVGLDPDTLATGIVLLATPVAVAFTVLYGFTVRWWTFWIGRALMISTSGVLGFVVVALARLWLGEEYPGRDLVRNTVYMMVLVGLVLKLVALLIDKIPLWRRKRERHSSDLMSDTS